MRALSVKTRCLCVGVMIYALMEFVTYETSSVPLYLTKEGDTYITISIPFLASLFLWIDSKMYVFI